MTLHVGALTHSGWAVLTPLLKALGWSSDGKEQVEQWYLSADTRAEGNVLLIHCRAERVLGRMLQRGMKPRQAIAQWQQQAEAMLAFFKANRRIARMVDAQCLRSNPAAVATLCETLGVAVPENTLTEADVADELQPDYLLVAIQLIRQNPALEALMAQLEACTLPLAEDSLKAPEPDLAAIIARQQKQQQDQKSLIETRSELTALKARHEDLKTQHADLKIRHSEQEQTLAQHQQENQLLLEQHHLVQEELEQKLISHNQQTQATEEQARSQQAELKRLQSELASAKTKADKLDTLSKTTEQHLHTSRAELAELKRKHADQSRSLVQYQQENQLLLEQLHLVQEELERQFLNRDALEEQLARYSQEQDHALDVANKHINRLQNELNRIKSSAAWKAVAPVRVLKRPFKRVPADKRKLKKQARQLAASEYFDSEWYLTTYPDVAENGVDPAEHYLKFGAEEGRNPSKRFDTQWYLQTNPDVKEAGLNPLIHFVDHGLTEGRAPNPQEQISLPSPTEVK